MRVPATSVWDSLDRDSRARLLDGAQRELARRSLPGALVYFGTSAAVLFASSCLRDHPRLTVAALAGALLGGLGRSFAAAAILRNARATGSRRGGMRGAPLPLWAGAMEAFALTSALCWGLFAAAIFHYYPGQWPSTYLLVVGAALAGGALTSCAPHLRMGFSMLVFIVLPTAICGILSGDRGAVILGISALGYFAFLLDQLRHAWQTYWKVAITLSHDAMVSKEAAAESQVRFQTLFEDAPSGIYLAFGDGRVDVANHALAQMLGYAEAGDLVGLNLKDFAHDRGIAELRGLIDEREWIAGFESDWRRRDGARIRVRESVRMIQSPGGTGIRPPGAGHRRVLGIVEDVTERFRAEQMRRQLIEILESTSDFVERVSPAGETLYMNHAARVLFHAGSLPDMNDPAELPRLRNGDDDLFQERLRFADRNGIWQGESALRAADGRFIPVSQVIIAHRINGEELYPDHSAGRDATHSYSIVSRDISAMREAESALSVAKEQLFRAQRMDSLGRLAGGVAHDFNNLLTVIIGQAALLQPRAADAETQEGLSQILKSAENAADLTRQLLAFGRRQILSKRAVDVAAIVTGAEKVLLRLIGDRIRLEIRLGGEAQNVLADPAQLEQVLVNLILNARDAMPEGGVATIETSVTASPAPAAAKGDDAGSGTPPREFVRISVSDTGIGMDEATMSRVFEPFFTTKEPGKGTGLGLATVYGFIEQSGGSISVSSTPGAGTTFVVQLPRIASAEPARTQEPRQSHKGGTERILIADDEPALLHLLSHMLRSKGYHVATAQSGDDALALVQAEPLPFDLLLTDVMMPGMSGPKLAEALRAMYPGMAVLFISGYPGVIDGNQAGAPSAGDYLAKPFTPDTLLLRVRQQLGARNPSSAAASA